MRIDAVTALTGLVALAAASFAVFQWSAAPPGLAEVGQIDPRPPALDRESLTAALSHLTAPAGEAAAPVQPMPRGPSLRLIGIMETDEGRVAVIDVDGRTLILRPGQEQAGVRVHAIDSSLAVVETEGGERRLSLGSP